MANFQASYRYMQPVLWGYFSGPINTLRGLGAAFDIAYNKYIIPNEGGYANIAADKGGETYAGIARNFNKTWAGWPLVDAKVKAANGKVKNNTKWKELEPYVADFYRERWNKLFLDQVDSQDVANLLFDYHVHSGGNAVKAIQKIVGVKPDGAMGQQTVAAINSFDHQKLFAALLDQRQAFLNSLVSKDASQSVFKQGWDKRLSIFRNTLVDVAKKAVVALRKPQVAIPVGGVLVAGAALVAFLVWQSNKKESELKPAL